MSSVHHNNKCKKCGKEFEDVIYQTTCISCLMKEPHPLRQTFTPWQPEITCKHEIKKTVVVHSTTTCETTVVVCQICNKWITKPKTEC